MLSRPLSLTTQLRYGLLVFSLVALLATGGLLIDISFRAQRERIAAAEREQSRAAAIEIDAYLDDIQRKLGYLAGVRGLTDQPAALQRSLLEALTRQNAAYEAVALLDGAGGVVVDVTARPPALEASVPGTPLFERCFTAGEDYIGPVQTTPATGAPYVMLGVPVRDGQDRVAGVLAARVSLTFLSNTLSDTRVGETGYAYVLDSRGELIAERAGLLDASAVVNFAERPPVPQLSPEGAAPREPYTGLYGETVLGAATRVATTGWQVVVELPTREAYAPLWRMAEVMVGALLITVLVAMACGLVLARRIVRPLERLIAAADRMSVGDMDVRVDAAAGNELGTLAAAFNTMSARVSRMVSEQAARAEAEAAQARFAFLAQASATLGASLDYQVTLANLARLVVPAIADWCTIDAREEDGALRRIAAAHRAPAREAELWALASAYPLDPQGEHPVARVIRSGMPVVISTAEQGQLAAIAADHRHLKLLEALRPRSVLVVPLRARGQILGAISFISEESGHYGDGTLAMAEDLAQRAATAVDNTLLYREAQQAIRARDEFLSVASHELKTPLTSVMGNAQLLQRRLARSETIAERDRRSITVIIDQIQRLNRLIDTLLDIGRFDRGQLAIQRAPLELGALVRRVVAEFQPVLDRHTLRCTLVGGPLPVVADELRLVQVLQNLLQNAVKYSPRGGLVEVRAERSGPMVSVAVADRGIGIPADALPQLFERFYRAGNTRQPQLAGLGIGLYVVKEIVTLHGGTIEVMSSEGEGSTFTVTLPLAPDGGEAAGGA